MTIQVQKEDRTFRISLPTGLICSKTLLRLALNSASVNGQPLSGVSPRAADALAAELRRIKRIHGTWDLVEVDSADGERVTITI